MLGQERHDLSPQLRGRRGTVVGAVVGEERVAGVLEHVDGEGLAGLLQALAQYLDSAGEGLASSSPQTTYSGQLSFGTRSTIGVGRSGVAGDASAVMPPPQQSIAALSRLLLHA